jgi:hypothetical protein
MPDIRNFRLYLEELSGNNLLKKKIASLERANNKLEKRMSELSAEVKLLKKHKVAVLPKKKGRKPRPMIQVIEDEMAKKKDKTMKVVDIVAMLKKKKVKTKARSIYSSVAAALIQNPKFEKVAPGVFKLVGLKAAPVKAAGAAGRKKGKKKKA